MRDYSKVSPKFWIGATGKKLRQGGIEAQLIGLYLMTCSHANMLGLYYLPKVFISHECGLTLEGASKGLQRCIEAGFCEYDEASEMVWVYEMALYQIADQLKPNDNRVQGVQNEYNTLPECPQLRAFYDKYQSSFMMTEQRGIEAPCKPLASQEQEQEQEQEQKAGTGAGTGIVPAAQKSAPTAQKEFGVNETALQTACKETWRCYGTAYFDRYGTEPVRNGKVNALVKQLVKRLGEKEAPQVAAHFVKSNLAYYIQRGHALDCMVADAEKLRTEWATGKSVTATRARQIDRAQANSSVVEEALALMGGEHAANA